MTAPSPAPSSGYSRAFEAFNAEPNDLVGLVACALYKKGIQEGQAAGRPKLQSELRNPSDAEKQAFRSSAQILLDAFALSAQQEMKERILDEGFRSDLEIVQEALKQHIDNKTRWTISFFVNLGAWLTTLIITAVVVATAPSWTGIIRAWYDSPPLSEAHGSRR